MGLCLALFRAVVLEFRTWTRVRLEFRFSGLGLETCELGRGLELAIYGLGLDTSGLELYFQGIFKF